MAGTTRALGHDGPAVAAIGYGAMGLSGAYGAISPAAAVRTLEHAIDVGMTFLDTSDTYGRDGDNERLVGRVIHRRREEVFVATKFGGSGTDPGAVGKAAPELVPRWLEASLHRLGTDHVDLYYLHRVDPATPVEDTFGAMSELVGAGKVRQLGISEAAAPTIRRAHAVHPLAAVQSEYSLLTRDVERTVLPLCAELGIGFVAYGPLSRGLLTGGVPASGPVEGDGRRGFPRFQPGALASNLVLADTVRAIAEREGCTPAQLCLAWLLHRQPPVVPLVGSTRPAHLDEDAAAVAVDLRTELVDELSASVDPSAVRGERYAPDRLARVDG